MAGCGSAINLTPRQSYDMLVLGHGLDHGGWTFLSLRAGRVSATKKAEPTFDNNRFTPVDRSGPMAHQGTSRNLRARKNQSEGNARAGSEDVLT